jgi:hypothetical protein
MDPYEGGRDDRVVALTRAPEPPLPADVARIASHLAHLLDEAVEARGAGSQVRDVAASFLGVAPAELATTSAHLAGLAFHLAALALAADFERHPPVALIGDDLHAPPRWERLDLGDHHPRIPVELAASCAAGTLADVPLVVAVDRDYTRDDFEILVYSRRSDGAAAQAWLDDLLARGQAVDNPYRGRVLEAGVVNGLGPVLRVVSPARTTREELVLPDEVWAEIDRNVHGLFAAADRLAAAGLGVNRGLLLEGPPGTGKTAICRALAAELAGPVTVVFCDARTIAYAVRDLYRALEHLGPALVVMEDVDLVIRHRGGGGGVELNDFLLALDGAVSRHDTVVTVATTNDVGAIDPAARRSARFDRMVTIDPPDEAARATILRRLLDGLGGDALDVDVGQVSRATPGRTGADLRELVSAAVLHVAAADRAGPGEDLDTALLLRLAATVGDDAHPGQYL